MVVATELAVAGVAWVAGVVVVLGSGIWCEHDLPDSRRSSNESFRRKKPSPSDRAH
jgi:NAD-dependent SIR2 family protein deacetylase